MHFHCFVVLVLILAVNGGTHLVKADHTACSTSKTGAFLPRLLRAYHVSSANGAGSASRRNEERVTIPEASKTTKVFYKLLLKLDTPPKNLFNRLRLEDPGIKLGDNPVFLQWLQYVIKFQAKKGEDAFSNGQLYDLLQNIKTESELVNFFHSLRRKPNMKNLADTMQRYMVLDSASSHKVMNNAWFNSRETPMEVWNILRLSDEALNDNPLFIQWLRYANLYSRATVKDDSFAGLQTLNTLLDAKRRETELGFGPLLQSIKDIPDLKKLAENMQTHLFQRWMTAQKIRPEEFVKLMANSMNRFVTLPKNDPSFKTIEAFTIQYAANRGGKEAVKTLFSDGEPQAAIAAAMTL